MRNSGLQNFTKRLLKTSDALAKIPSLGWGLSYFITILIFAVVYKMNSTGFYHTTSQFEKNLNEDAIEILNSIESSLVTVTNFSPANYDGWTLLKDEFEVHSLRHFDNNIGFTVLTVFEKDNAMVSMNVELNFKLNEELITCTEKNECYSTHFLQTTRPIFDKENNFEALTPQALSYYGDIHWFKTPLTLDKKIKGYVAAKKGFPSEASGSFNRMLYLSVVTITTLGYGDIVPISGLNRFLVGLESIIGLIIVGLFLNSLSRERRKVL
ncbi:potassium channel family protein [Psychrobacter sp. HD31]|uniref:potassium channel family protein n=1 Tax=Psychrobacter sp. HD31 TaxID=3112003 RepID=UPI003DA349BB